MGVRFIGFIGFIGCPFYCPFYCFIVFYWRQRHRAMRWAQRLKRVFNIDVSTCEKCGGEAKIIASIEDQAVIDKILNHLMKKGALPPQESRGHPSFVSIKSNNKTIRYLEINQFDYYKKGWVSWIFRWIFRWIFSIYLFDS
jgi:hypothetical protein